MKKYLIGFIGYFLPLATFANGMEENPSVAHQLEELLPFEHLEHGHWFAVILSVLLWISLVYTIYSLVKKTKKSKAGESI